MCIEWLFFDVGNTLVDESKAYETRLREAAALIGKPYELIQEEALDFYRQNDKGDLAVMDKYGIPKPKWPKEDERLYPETVEVLKALKAKYKIGVIANQSLGTAARLQAWGINLNIFSDKNFGVVYERNFYCCKRQHLSEIRSSQN